MRFYLYHFNAMVKSLEPRCACTEVVLRLSDPSDMVQNEHPVDVRFAPTEAERRHKSGASASRYANIGQGAVCQWHTFSTDRSGNGDVGVRSTEQSVRHLLTPTPL